MPERRSPLDGWSWRRSDLTMRELPNLAQISVRDSVAPAEPALQLGPDEWLVIGPAEARDALLARLRQAAAGRHAQVVDTSASRTVIELSGSGADAILAMGCGLDLHPQAFPVGRVAASILARTGVILHRLDAAPTWRVFVRASYARYLHDWLLAAAGD